MPNYQDHLLFGAVLVLVTSYGVRPFISLDITVLVVTAACILLASVFPDVDHRGSIIHQRLRAVIILVGAGATAGMAYPHPVSMIVGAVAVAAGLGSLFEYVKPAHRTVTHTLRFCVFFSAVIGAITYMAFGTFLPAAFTFVSYLSHLILDGMFSDVF